jgi:hypothetical protein
LKLRDNSAEEQTNSTHITQTELSTHIRRSALVGHRSIIQSSRGVCSKEEYMVAVRKIMKVTLLAAYFGLFAMLIVAAGDFVLHG